MKTGVLVHGIHLGAKNWERIIWGEPPFLLGRAPKGLLVALQETAEVIVFGTGASEKDGKKEADYTRDYLMEHFYKLAAFPDFQYVNLIETKIRMEKIIKTETRSVSTLQEVKYAGEIFREAGVERVILVSSPVHIARCLRDAYAVYSRNENLKYLSKNLFATPSDVGWADASDVVILEPPHRPDRSDTLYRLIKGITELPENSQIRLLGELHREQFFKK